MAQVKPTFIVDEEAGAPKLKEIASLIEKMRPEVLAGLRAHFNFDQDERFYQGLCSGLASAVTLVRGLPTDELLGTLEAMLIIAANQVAEVDAFANLEELKETELHG